MCDCPKSEPESRRGFLREGLSIVLGGLVTAVPVLAGVVSWLDPLRRQAGGAGLTKVATLDALPADGVPRKFPVIADKVDAWTRTPNVPIGAVYLRRTQDGVIRALHTVCPHAGCFVDYQAARSGYYCPCHNSLFLTDGKIGDAKSPSPRDMDSLEVEVRGSEIWVKFQNFRAGHKEKIPV